MTEFINFWWMVLQYIALGLIAIFVIGFAIHYWVMQFYDARLKVLSRYTNKNSQNESD